VRFSRSSSYKTSTHSVPFAVAEGHDSSDWECKCGVRHGHPLPRMVLNTLPQRSRVSVNATTNWWSVSDTGVSGCLPHCVDVQAKGRQHWPAPFLVRCCRFLLQRDIINAENRRQCDVVRSTKLNTNGLTGKAAQVERPSQHINASRAAVLITKCGNRR
jgi:hypothetical protein